MALACILTSTSCDGRPVGPGADCRFPGTYQVTSTSTSTSWVSGSGVCVSEYLPKEIRIRLVDSGMSLYIERPWEDELVDYRACTLTARFPAGTIEAFHQNWRYSRELTLTLEGDRMSGELTDEMEDTRQPGRECVAITRIVAQRIPDRDMTR